MYLSGTTRSLLATITLLTAADDRTSLIALFTRVFLAPPGTSTAEAVLAENANAAKESNRADLTVIDFNPDISSSFYIINDVQCR
jgi:hypothetical protein